MKVIKLNKKNIFIAVGVLILSMSLVLFNGTVAQQQTDENSSEIVAEYSYEYPYETLEDLIKDSTYVVVGSITNKEEIGKWSERYTMSVEASYLNELFIEEIDVYEAKNTLQVGKKYILFLEAKESEFYPRTIFTSIVKDSVLEIEEDYIQKANKYTGEKMVVKELENFLKKQGKHSEKVKDDKKVIDKHDSNEALINSSDVIIEVSVTNVKEFNKFVSHYEVEVKNEYKGSIGDIKKLTLPTGIDEEGEVVLFLKEIGKQNYTIAARKDCVISKDDSERWNEISLLLGK